MKKDKNNAAANDENAAAEVAEELQIYSAPVEEVPEVEFEKKSDNETASDVEPVVDVELDKKPDVEEPVVAKYPVVVKILQDFSLVLGNSLVHFKKGDLVTDFITVRDLVDCNAAVQPVDDGYQKCPRCQHIYE